MATSTAVPKIAVQNVSLSRSVSVSGESERRRILDGVSMSVRSGEIFGIIGPSGSGKTSLLRVLNGLDSPEEGSVLLDGADTAAIDILRLRRRIGMVFQIPALFPGSVADNVSYALNLAGATAHEAKDRGMACLEQVGLAESFWGRVAEELSVGERQRVAIARALAPGPEVLLMDEPTSALDPSAASRILALVRSLNEDLGVTLVFVTHLMQQAREICGRAMVLIEGRGVEEGDVELIFGRPSCEMTRLFIEGDLDVIREPEDGSGA